MIHILRTAQIHNESTMEMRNEKFYPELEAKLKQHECIKEPMY